MSSRPHVNALLQRRKAIHVDLAERGELYADRAAALERAEEIDATTVALTTFQARWSAARSG